MEFGESPFRFDSSLISLFPLTVYLLPFLSIRAGSKMFLSVPPNDPDAPTFTVQCFGMTHGKTSMPTAFFTDGDVSEFEVNLRTQF